MHHYNFKNIDIEINIYNEIFEILGWRVLKRDNEEFLTIDGFLPIVVNKKQLVRLQKHKITHETNIITFRPYKNSRQCQFLMDRLLEEDEVEKISTFKEYEDNIPSYSAIMIQKETDEVMLQVDGCKTETEAKFRLFMNFYFGDKYDEDIDLMIEEEEKFKEMKHELNEKHKQEMEIKNNKKKGKKK